MVEICSRCLMLSTRPRVVFTDGICNACRFHEDYAKVNFDDRRQEFLGLVKTHKTHPVYDCIVPFSGGKDSASIAYRLKTDYGLNPLLVCYGQLLWTDAGRHNLNRVAEAGFDILYWRANQKVSRHLARRFFIERGHPKQHYDSAVNAVPIITAKQLGIPLIVYAEHGESFYGGHVLSEEHRKTRDLAEVLENQVGDDARNWADDTVSERDLYPYIYPDDVAGLKAVYFSYFHKWDIFGNAKFCREKLNFKVARNGANGGVGWGKSDGSFEGFDSIDDKIDDIDYYLMWIKFGFGRATRMASRLIQGGHLARAHGLALAKRWDGQYPRSYLADNLAYLRMTEDEFIATVDKHRNSELWEKNGKTWRLKFDPSL